MTSRGLFRTFFNWGGKIAHLYTKRVLTAQKDFISSIQAAAGESLSAVPDGKVGNPWQAWASYVTDSFQRGILFWDTLRQRGNNFLEHERAGKPPLLVFDYETILDGRKLERPVNYALVRIIPPPGPSSMRRNAPLSSWTRARGTDRGSAGSSRTPRS